MHVADKGEKDNVSLLYSIRGRDEQITQEMHYGSLIYNSSL